MAAILDVPFVPNFGTRDITAHVMFQMFQIVSNVPIYGEDGGKSSAKAGA